MFAVTVGDAVYRYRYSLLGLPEDNLHWTPWDSIPLPTSAAAAVAQQQPHQQQPTVLLWVRRNDTWVSYPWLPQLWWARLLAVSHSMSMGTRAEAFAHARTTSRVLFWWLQPWVPFFFPGRNPCPQHTTISQRVAFFHNPCLHTVAAQMDAENAQWRTRAGRFRRPANTVRRLWRWARSEVPWVLPPCPAPSANALPANVVAYSIPYSVKAATRLLLSEGGAMGQAPGYTMCVADVDRLLVGRYGCRLAEIPFNTETPIEYLIPNVTGFPLPPSLQSARIQQWPTVGCTVLQYNNNRYITPMEVDNVSRTFLCWLCLGIACKPHRFVLVDAEPTQQRALFADIHRTSAWSQVVWLADSSAAAMSLEDHLGGDVCVDTVSAFVCKEDDDDDKSEKSVHTHDGDSMAVDAEEEADCALVVVGMHRLSFVQQTALLQTIATVRSGAQWTFFLVGDVVARRCGAFGVDPWSCCCLAAVRTADGVGELCRRGVRHQARGTVSVYTQPTVERMPPCVIETGDDDDDAGGGGAAGLVRWLKTPYDHTGRLALWFAHSVRVEPDAVVLASSEYVYKILASVLFAERGVVRLPTPLWDHTTPGVGDVLRCVSGCPPLAPKTTYCILGCNPKGVVTLQSRTCPPICVPMADVAAHCILVRTGLLYSLPAKGQCVRCVHTPSPCLTVGAVYCVEGYDATFQVHVQLRRRDTGTVIDVPIADLRASCVLAWVGLLQDAVGCHYGDRPVYVLLSGDAHTYLHAAHCLSTSVVVVASSRVMQTATQAIKVAFDNMTPLPQSMWHELMDFLAPKH